LLNTRVGLVLAYTAFFLPFSIYLMTAFYRGLPRELLEAARMDGARFLEVWWHVMLPMGRPALLTLGILNTLYCWNDVLISLLVLQDERTLMVGSRPSGESTPPTCPFLRRVSCLPRHPSCSSTSSSSAGSSAASPWEL
jgi:multiple sugar transport system permease protein